MGRSKMDRKTEKIDLIKKVYSKTDYTKIIDTRFQQLGNISVNQQIDETVTVNDFFESYNDLFYDIPFQLYSKAIFYRLLFPYKDQKLVDVD